MVDFSNSPTEGYERERDILTCVTISNGLVGLALEEVEAGKCYLFLYFAVLLELLCFG